MQAIQPMYEDPIPKRPPPPSNAIVYQDASLPRSKRPAVVAQPVALSYQDGSRGNNGIVHVARDLIYTDADQPTGTELSTMAAVGVPIAHQDHDMYLTTMQLHAERVMSVGSAEYEAVGRVETARLAPTVVMQDEYIAVDDDMRKQITARPDQEPSPSVAIEAPYNLAAATLQFMPHESEAATEYGLGFDPQLDTEDGNPGPDTLQPEIQDEYMRETTSGSS